MSEEYDDLAYLSLESSARLGSYWAQDMLVTIYTYSQRERAEKWLSIVADHDPEKIMLTANESLFMANNKEDYQYVRNIFLMALQHDVPEAGLSLGYLEITQWTEGCRSLDEALNWFNMSAKKGNERAQLIMAIAEGAGVTNLIDHNIAVQYLKKNHLSDDAFVSMFANLYLDTFSVVSHGKKRWLPISEILRKDMPEIISYYMKSTTEFHNGFDKQRLTKCLGLHQLQ